MSPATPRRVDREHVIARTRRTVLPEGKRIGVLVVAVQDHHPDPVGGFLGQSTHTGVGVQLPELFPIIGGDRREPFLGDLHDLLLGPPPADVFARQSFGGPLRCPRDLREGHDPAALEALHRRVHGQDQYPDEGDRQATEAARTPSRGSLVGVIRGTGSPSGVGSPAPIGVREGHGGVLRGIGGDGAYG